MSSIFQLQSRKLGLLELISMGFEVYLKNLKPILLLFCTIYLPLLIILSALNPDNQNNPSGLFLAFFVVVSIVVNLAGIIYIIALSLITENYLHGRDTSYQSAVQKIVSSLLPIVGLVLIFWINYLLRFLLLIIPGIVYAVNNQYYGLAFILRDQRGKEAFDYSRSIVEGNWWKVLFFIFLSGLSALGLQFILNSVLTTLPFMKNFWGDLLSVILPKFIVIGIAIGNILLFLNLDYQKSLES
ncbi:MAG: hypothetical protein F6J90_39335 [Moorea sp. SIOASIH]|uniref:hypothetical protein n=1 Tax=Moorena sp. SIOASIH TaxID=2607817 RepID=UPI0013BBDB30|nr:hypothetical protein [Moorena sp. SIOASIH]NEO42056.1 hypothetical protein [Moorena sp. SIOASIH]